MDINILQSFLKNIEGKIPEHVNPSRTIFDIMKQPHTETVWSNIYAFFFNPNEEHQMGDVFLRSLIDLIYEKSKLDFTDINSSEIIVKTEDSTTDRKRLDIALLGKESAILIENKVYASIYNPLNAYWTNYSQRNKIGIVLSLYKTKPNEENWINVTHLELIERVNSNLRLKNNNQFYSFYKEFRQNVINMTNKVDISTLNFYWENREILNTLGSLVGRIEENIKEQIIENMSNIGFDGSYWISNCKGLYFYKEVGKEESKQRNKGRNKQHCVIAIFLNGLYNIQEPQIIITVEIINKDFISKCINKRNNGDKTLKRIFSDNLNTNNDWEHICGCHKVSVRQDSVSKIGEDIVYLLKQKIENLDMTIIDAYKYIDKLYAEK